MKPFANSIRHDALRAKGAPAQSPALVELRQVRDLGGLLLLLLVVAPSQCRAQGEIVIKPNCDLVGEAHGATRDASERARMHADSQKRLAPVAAVRSQRRHCHVG